VEWYTVVAFDVVQAMCAVSLGVVEAAYLACDRETALLGVSELAAPEFGVTLAAEMRPER